MNSFAIALFVHIVGALGVSVALGFEWIGLLRIRKATVPEEIRAILGIAKDTGRLGFLSMLATAITGIYMVMAAVGWVPWILVVIGALILAMMVARVLTMPRVTAIDHALASEKASVSQSLHNLINDPILWISVQTGVAIVLGILFLKIAAPGLGGSLLTIAVAIVLGLVSALPMFRPVRVHEVQAD